MDLRKRTVPLGGKFRNQLSFFNKPRDIRDDASRFVLPPACHFNALRWIFVFEVHELDDHADGRSDLKAFTAFGDRKARR